jgi:hypothetical protein
MITIDHKIKSESIIVIVIMITFLILMMTTTRILILTKNYDIEEIIDNDLNDDVTMIWL